MAQILLPGTARRSEAETQLLTVAASLVACMFGLLATVIGWMGSKQSMLWTP